MQFVVLAFHFPCFPVTFDARPLIRLPFAYIHPKNGNNRLTMNAPKLHSIYNLIYTLHIFIYSTHSQPAIVYNLPVMNNIMLLICHAVPAAVAMHFSFNSLFNNVIVTFITAFTIVYFSHFGFFFRTQKQ